MLDYLKHLSSTNFMDIYGTATTTANKSMVLDLSATQSCFVFFLYFLFFSSYSVVLSLLFPTLYRSFYKCTINYSTIVTLYSELWASI